MVSDPVIHGNLGGFKVDEEAVDDVFHCSWISKDIDGGGEEKVVAPCVDVIDEGKVIVLHTDAVRLPRPAAIAAFAGSDIHLVRVKRVRFDVSHPLQ